MTGLRRNEGGMIRKEHIDLIENVLHIPDTKTGHPHALPITPVMMEILRRRIIGLQDGELLFDGVSLDHLAEMAMRAGAPRFMLHDLRKMVATVGERLEFSDAVIRKILNHKAKKSDTLHRHYIMLSVSDVYEALMAIQRYLLSAMKKYSTIS
jgi:integrase